MWDYVILLFVAIIIMKLLDKKITKKSSKKESTEKHITEYRGHYQAKQLLTRNEWHEYKKLKKYTDEAGLMICPKVRLLDIVEPRSGDPHYMAYMGKVKSKHVDFVICDKDLHIMGILELDDSSHDRTDRQERDKFVDEILTDVGYTVIHTRSITEYTLDAITGGRKIILPEIAVDLRTDEEKEFAKQIRLNRDHPTFEEWKAQQEQKKTEE